MHPQHPQPTDEQSAEADNAPTQRRPRRPRSDRGAIRYTPRDAAALAWIAQMYGVRADVLAHLLGCSTARAARVADRWERAGWVQRARVEAGAPPWIYATPGTAAEQLGWERAGVWRPTLNNARHTHFLCRVRAYLQPPHGEMSARGWTPERVLLREEGASRAGVRRTHIPDGVWHRPASADFPQGQHFVIEAELSPKSIPRMVEIMQANAGRAARYGDARAGRVLYVTPDERMAAHVARGREELGRVDPEAARRVDVTRLAHIQCTECAEERQE